MISAKGLGTKGLNWSTFVLEFRIRLVYSQGAAFLRNGYIIMN